MFIKITESFEVSKLTGALFLQAQVMIMQLRPDLPARPVRPALCA